MSASDKKKLRKEQSAAFLSERQKQEQSEAKKLKIYTISFVAAMLLIVCTALAIVGVRAVRQSGVFEKNTIAATVGNKTLNTVELNYYFIDSINSFYNDWYEQYANYTDSYLSAMGFDTKKPLNEQYYDADASQTWADYFLEAALEQARYDIALYDMAVSENFELPEDDRTTLDNTFNNLETYAKLYGYANSTKYLSAMYGNGADAASYKEYSERSAIASAYYNAHKESLEYDNAALREYETDKYNDFNTYSYSASYLSYTEFTEGGTLNQETGVMEYTPEDKAAAMAALEAAAAKLSEATTAEELETLVKEVEVNENSQTALNSATNVLHSEIDSTIANWLAEDERKAGDIGIIPSTTTTKNADGEEFTETTGYYAVVFKSKNENIEPMGNVRHLLVKFTGGTEDAETGETVYTEEEMQAAKDLADGYLKTWQEGDATEESFIALVKEHSDDTSAEDGGLFEDIHPNSEYVAEFLNWSIDPAREKGDVEVIQTQYGYHVMYYVGDDELTYRDYMITNALRDADQLAWYNSILEPVTATLNDISRIQLDLTMSGN